MDVSVARIIDARYLDKAPPGVLYCCEVQLYQRGPEDGETRHFLIDFYDSAFVPQGRLEPSNFQTLENVARQWLESHLAGQLRPVPEWRWGKATIVEYRS